MFVECILVYVCDIYLDVFICVDCIVFGLLGGVKLEVCFFGFDVDVLCVFFEEVMVCLYVEGDVFDICINWCNCMMIFCLNVIEECVCIIGIICENIVNVLVFVMDGV